MQHFQKLHKYGELLLSLSANCRKLQTESEKIIPCGDFEESTITDNPADKDQFKLQALDLQTHLDLTEDEMKAQMDLMKNFWLRQALVEAQTVLMEEKKRQLIEENQKYINKIKALSKTDKASDLQATLHVQCVMEEDPICPALCKLHLK